MAQKEPPLIEQVNGELERSTNAKDCLLIPDLAQFMYQSIRISRNH